MAIKYGGKTTPDYSAMQGPCPEGFHVPTINELQGIVSLLSSSFGISYSGDNLGQYLLMPFTGYRNRYRGSTTQQGSRGWYWSATGDSRGNAKAIYFTSGSGGVDSGYSDCTGMTIRPFKDIPVVPDSSWATLYDGSSVATGAGIFHISTPGLISVSGDGINRITIADKNLGATTVYISGDTLSESNCGGYFQRGNNYMFPYSGTITTSNTQVDASEYGPGNYYSSNIFIGPSRSSDSEFSWNTPANPNLRGGETGVQQKPVDLVKRYYGGKMINDVQGPSPDGFHVPSVTEWMGLKNIMSGLSLTTGDNWKINLHMPFAGSRDYYDASLITQGSNGNYWSSSPGSASSYDARLLYLSSSYVDADSNFTRANGLSVRCFKDSYVTPDSTWTVVQGTLGSAGIFWNQSQGLISITDGSTGYTIMDKNLGATTVYNDGDTLSQANMGNMYQWGNNYGFPSTGTISKTSSTQVDASNYGPNTDNGYYSSDTFITGSYDWSSVHNDNLWGGVTKGHHPAEVKKVYYGGTLVDDYSAMRGPCPEGFHVPMISEWQGINTIMTWLNISDGSGWNRYLKLPFAGYVDYNGFVTGVRNDGYYLTCSPYQSNLVHKIYINYYDTLNISYTDEKGGANSIRPFKDTFVEPTASWTVLAGTLGDAGIFYNATLGLISITPDGTPGYTIADKNLGATAVYNQGDTLTDDNCGYFYQWGNNYGFTGNAITTTSSTQVDASGYGPGNYYSSDTFITGNQDWSSVPNDNLRGGETGIQQSPALIREDNS